MNDSSDTSSQSEDHWKEGRQRPRRSKVAAVYGPEATLAMAAVMALKLAYGLDDKRR